MPNNPQPRTSNPSRPAERNVRLVLSYDGTAYFGWQRQKDELSVQSAVESALHKVLQEKAVVYCAGRTDRGVHALGQAVNFYTISKIRTDKLKKALNAVLPRDIRVLDAVEKGAGFHARYSATRRWYRYYLYNDEVVSPFWERYSLHCPFPLELPRLRRALSYLRGEHDFTSLCSLKDESPVKRRRIYRAAISAQRPLVHIDLVADGFLYNMVRIIVGTLLDINKDRLAASVMKDIIAAKDRDRAGQTAAPQGLFLMGVAYGNRGSTAIIKEELDDGPE